MAKQAWLSAGVAVLALAANGARAEEPADQVAAWHIQATTTVQGHPAFSSPYRGAQSLDPGARAAETSDITLYGGVRPWAGAELWINPEIDEGFGLSNTLGVAGFPSGEAYKVGARDPYLKLPRLFLRQTFNLDGASDKVDPDLNVLGGHRAADRIVVTLGKFGVPDVFDSNSLAHDPRQDFLNWALIDTGTFDYAADAWGYTYGAAAEWYRGAWTVRGGLFDLSQVPNSTTLDGKFAQFQAIAEVERRYALGGQAGKIAVTGFLTRGRAGRFADAVAAAQATGGSASIAAVRQYRSRTGFSLNLEQAINDRLGLFVRAGEADGDVEPYEFADIDRTLAFGLSQSGAGWTRPDDRAAVAVVVNDISKAHRAYLAAGGTGILVGDGQLTRAGPEGVLETYYNLAVAKALHVTFDYQFVENPAYNRERGPVSVFGLRVHAQY